MGCRRSTRDVDVVVVPLEKALPIEVERLLNRMRRDAFRKRDFQAAPRLTVFLPRFKFFRLDVGQREEKRRIHVRPHRIPCEVRQLQPVPGRLERVISEGLAWIGPFLNDLTVARLNRDSIGLKGRVSILLSERPMRRPFLAQVDRQMDIVQNAVLTLHFPENAALQKMRGNSLHPPPPVETPAGVDRKCREIIHASAPSCLQLCAHLWLESALGQAAGAISSSSFLRSYRADPVIARS